jgi:hypothetical protein
LDNINILISVAILPSWAFRHFPWLFDRTLPGVSFACACVLCMTLFSVLILTVGHDNTGKCMCMLCMTLFRVLVLTVGHDSLMCIVCVCVYIGEREREGRKERLRDGR